MALTNRFSGTLKGAMTLIGSGMTLNDSDPNNYFPEVFMTTDHSQQVPGYPPGTTLNQALNSCMAVLNYPAGSRVVFAHLSWSGLNVTGMDPVTLTTPASTYQVTPTLTDWIVYYGYGYTWLGADVTSIINSDGPGQYTIGNVPSGVGLGGSADPGVGWSMIVVYENDSMPYRYFNINTGPSYVDTSNPNIFNTGNFFTPNSGPVTGYMVMSYVYGDFGDSAQVFVGSSAPGTQIGNASNPWDGLQPYNRINGMFPGNICYADCNSPSNIGLLNTTGTFGNNNVDPYTQVYGVNSRTEYDVAGFDISPQLTNNQDNLYVNVNFSGPGGAVILGESAQVDINSPLLTPLKSVDKAYANLGSTLNYTISFTNTGLVPADNVILIDTIPAGASFVPGSMVINGTPTIASPVLPGVNIGNIGAGQSMTITFQAAVSNVLGPTTLQNVASLGYSFISSPSLPAIYGNEPTNAVTTTIATAILEASKSSSPSYADVGTVITYTITITNTGNTTANSIVLSDTIPAGTTFVTGSLNQDGTAVPGSPTPPGIALPNPIAPGAVSTITFQVLVQSIPAGNQVSNIASVGYSYTVNPSIPDGASGSVSTNTASTSISHSALGNMTKTVSQPAAAVGDILTYTISMSNTGNTTTNNIVLIDTIPTGTSLLPGSLYQDGTLVPGSPNPPGLALPNPIAPGGTSTVTFKIKVNSIPNASSETVPNSATAFFAYSTSPTLSVSGMANSNILDLTVNGSAIINTAAATFTYVVSPTITSTGSGNSNAAPTSVYSPIISAVKSVSASSAELGQVLTYTVTLSNSGNTTANNYLFTDTIPGGTTFVPGSLMVNGASQPGNPAPPAGVTLPDLGMGQTNTVTFQVTAVSVPSPNPTPNSAVSNYTFIVDPALGTVRNGATITNTVSTTIVSNAIITPVKMVDKNAVFVGDTLNYTVVFTNNGSGTANSVFFTDTTPSGATFVANSVKINGVAQPGAILNPPAGITLPAIGPNQTTTLTYQVIASTIPSPNPLLNQGTASYGTFVGTSIVNTNTVPTFVHHSTGPVKTADKTNANIGDTIVYTLAWTEMDGMTAQNVTFVDTIPNATSFVANSLAINGIPQPGATILPPTGVNVGSVGPNQTVTVTFQVKVMNL